MYTTTLAHAQTISQQCASMSYAEWCRDNKRAGDQLTSAQLL